MSISYFKLAIFPISVASSFSEMYAFITTCAYILYECSSNFMKTLEGKKAKRRVEQLKKDF